MASKFDPLQQAFLAREIVIDCPSLGCGGKLITGRREVDREDAATACVVLRCTRQPDEHAHAIAVEPYTGREAEAVVRACSRGEAPSCPRCAARLEFKAPDAKSEPASEVVVDICCPWCGAEGRFPNG